MLPALWIFSAVPCAPKQVRNVLTSEAGVGASPTIASRAPWPFSPAACSGAIPYAVRIWFGYRPPAEPSAAGKVDGTQPNAGVPVRVGVPPSATTRPAADELLPERAAGASRRRCRRCP